MAGPIDAVRAIHNAFKYFHDVHLDKEDTHLGHDDRETMTRTWQKVMPPEAFTEAAQLVAEAIGDDWPELTRRIPELAGAH